MMRIVTFILFLIIVLVSMYLHKESGHRQQMKQLQEIIDKSERREDSLNQILDSANHKVKKYLIEASDARRKALQIEHRFDLVYEENRILKRTKPVRYNVVEVDSLIGARYGQQ